MIITALVFLLLLSVLVLIHEAGHYFTAKKLGIKVEEFGFGFPPKAFSIKRGETEYSINWLPIGGFVKLYGEDDAGGGRLTTGNKELPKSDLKRAFFARPVWQRASVVVAGVVMNTVLAVFIYYSFLGISNFKTELPLLGDHTFFGVHQTNKHEIIVSNVVKDSPAANAGLTVASKIISLNGKSVLIDEFVEIVKQNKGKEITLSWQDLKTNKISTARLIPRVNPPKGQGSLGIQFGPIDTAILEYKTPLQKTFSGVIHPLNLMAYNFDVIGKLISISFKEKTVAPVSEGVSGPVGIYSLVGDILRLPIKEATLQLLNLAGLLSISLAFFNVLPIPALDGGRLFFIIFEGITGKKVKPEVENRIHAVGMMVLLGLILLITFKDVFQLFTR